MEFDEDVSEKYRKYLLRITYANQDYFTISGADLEDEEKGKVLINSNNQIVLFSDVTHLLKAIKMVNIILTGIIFKNGRKGFLHLMNPMQQ
jgi:hypothetical protein